MVIQEVCCGVLFGCGCGEEDEVRFPDVGWGSFFCLVPDFAVRVQVCEVVDVYLRALEDMAAFEFPLDGDRVDVVGQYDVLDLFLDEVLGPGCGIPV